MATQFEIDLLVRFREEGLSAITTQIRSELQRIASLDLGPQTTATAVSGLRTQFEAAALLAERRGVRSAEVAGLAPSQLPKEQLKVDYAITPQEAATLRGAFSSAFTQDLPLALVKAIDRAKDRLSGAEIRTTAQRLPSSTLANMLGLDEARAGRSIAQLYQQATGGGGRQPPPPRPPTGVPFPDDDPEEQLTAIQRRINSLYRAAELDNQIADNQENYLQYFQEAAVASRLRAAAENESLAISGDYTAALQLAATAAQQRVAAENAALASDADYLAANTLAAAALQQRAAAETAALAADADYIARTTEAAAAKNALAAAESRGRAGSQEYIDSTVRAAAERNALLAVERAALAGDQAYLDATTAAAAERSRLAAAEARTAAASQRYLDATTADAAAKRQLAANELAARAVNDEYLQATAEEAANKRALSAAERETIARLPAYTAELVRDQAAKRELAAVERQALAGNQRYLRATVSDATAKERLAASEREMLARNQAYINATVAATRAQAELEANQAQARLRDPELGRQVLRRDVGVAQEAARLSADRAASEEYIEATTAAATEKKRLAATEAEARASDEEYVQATARLATARNVLATREAQQAALPGAAAATAARKVAEDQRRLAERAALLAAEPRGEEVFFETRRAGESDAELRARVATEERIRRLRERNDIQAAIIRNERGELAEKARERQLERDYRAALAEQTRLVQQQAREERRRAGIPEPGSAFQRAQATLARRQGRPDRDVTEFQTLGQFVAGKALTTAGFALTGSLFYGAVQGISQMVREAENLERILNQVRSQFESIGEAEAFEGFRDDILAIARETGQASDEVAFVAFQLKGAFGDTARAVEETTSAIRIARVTGLQLNEIVDSLTAISRSFESQGISIEDVGDKALGLQERLGVLAKETIAGLADIAPVAAEVGLSFEQSAALLAVAQQVSGRSETALAEQFGRILPAIHQYSVEIASLYRNNTNLADSYDTIVSAIGGGNFGTVLDQLIRDWEDLSEAQQQQVVTLLGGRREAQAFLAVANNSAKYVNELSNSFDDAGKTASYFSDLQETVSQGLARLSAQFTQLGEALFRAGLSDLLVAVLGVARDLLSVIARLADMFADLNEALGGLPGRMLLVAAAMRTIVALATALRNARLREVFGSILGTRGRPPVAGAAAGAAQQLSLFGAAPAAAGAARTGLAGRLGALGSRLLGPAGFIIGGTVLASWQTAAENARAEAQSSFEEMLDEQRTSMDELRAMAGDNGDFWEQLGNIIKRRRPRAELARAAIARREAKREFEEFDRGRQQGVFAADAEGQGGVEVDALARRLRIESPAASRPRRPLRHDRLTEAEIAQLREQAQGDINKFSELYRQRERVIIEAERANTDVARANRERIEREAALLNDPRARGLSEELRRIVGSIKPGERFTATQIDELYERALAGSENAIDIIRGLVALQRSTREGAAVLDRAAALAKATPGEGGAPSPNLLDAQGLLQAYEAGQISLFEYVQASQGIIDTYRDIGELDAAMTKDLIKIRGDQNRVLSENARGLVDQQLEFAALSGQGGPQQRVQVLGRLLASGQLRDPKVIQDTAKDLLEAQKAVLDFRISMADSAEDALAEMRRGITFPQEARGAYLQTALETTNQEWQRFLVVMFGGVQEGAQFTQRAVELFLTQGISLAEISRGAIRKRIRALAEQLEQLRRMGEDTKEVQEQIRKLYALEAEILKAPPVPPPVPSTITVDEQTRKQQEVRAAEELRQSQQDLARARAEGDPIRQAELALREADDLARRATSQTERNRAATARIAAQRQLESALLGLFVSQKEGVQIALEIAGDTVGAARVGVELVQEQLSRLIAQITAAGGDPNRNEEVQNLRNQLRQAVENVRATDFARKVEDIDFFLEMEQITTQQAIAQLEALLSIANPEETRDLLRKIKSLRDGLGKDYQFNIGELRLPTRYEAARLGEAESRGGSYQDNRQVFVEINVNNAQDNAAAVARLTEVLQAGNRVGPTARLY